MFPSFKKPNFGFNFNFNFKLGVKVKNLILNLKLKLKLKSKSGKMSVKIILLLPIVTSDLASIVIYRVLQFIFKAMEILLFFSALWGLFIDFNYCVVYKQNKGFPSNHHTYMTQGTQ